MSEHSEAAMSPLKPEPRPAASRRFRGAWLLAAVAALMALTSLATWLAAAALHADGRTTAQRPTTLIECESREERQPGMLLRCTVPRVGPTLEI